VKLKKEEEGIKTKRSHKTILVLPLNFTEAFTCKNRLEGGKVPALQ